MIKKLIVLACLVVSSVMAGLPFSLDPFGRFGQSAYVAATGGVIGWGYNGNGQTTIPSSATNVIAISAGHFHSLALQQLSLQSN